MKEVNKWLGIGLNLPSDFFAHSTQFSQGLITTASFEQRILIRAVDHKYNLILSPSVRILPYVAHRVSVDSKLGIRSEVLTVSRSIKIFPYYSITNHRTLEIENWGSINYLVRCATLFSFPHT